MNPSHIIVAGLELPALAPSHKLHTVLISALRQQSLMAIGPMLMPPWNADFFGLDRATIFQASTPKEQTQILQHACQGLLQEVYTLEKAGVGYMAKMTLLAETIEERMLYALFSAHKAMHLAQLRPLVPQAQTPKCCDAFFQRLEALLECADRSVLLLITQVVLEGWGISQYRHLSQYCCHPMLGELFQHFLNMQATHHLAGTTLFDRAHLSSQSYEMIVEALSDFLQVVRLGPQRLVSAIAGVKGAPDPNGDPGELSSAQTIRLLQDLEAERYSAGRLALVRALLEPVAPDVVAVLAQRNLFTPLPPEACV
ncbi:MAG: ferritin-like domain-containing protein [Cyanobacteria bacterium P01_F01_bin.53]